MPSGLPKVETSSTTRYDCADCGVSFIGWKTKKRKYCGGCVSKHSNGGGDMRAGFKRRHGDDWEKHFELWRQGQSKRASGVNNPRYGKSMSEEGKRVVGERTKGKTYEELYGAVEADRIKKTISRPGELNPAYGKVYFDGGKSVKGHYKGKFFRSLLEYSFMKHLESRDFSLETDVRYECYRIPFVFEGRNRTYHIDFHVLPEQTVYEVKPIYVMRNPSALQLAKWEAAKAFCTERGLQFKVVTEEDFPKIRFKDAYDGDTEVEWDERTFKYFKAARNHLGRIRENRKDEYCQGLI